MPYIGVSPFNGVRRKHTYTATASQTSFSGAGTEGATLTYKDSTFVDVFQNGVKLGEADYTSTSGTAIVKSPLSVILPAKLTAPSNVPPSALLTVSATLNTS